jgi:ketosteroid isomerase-like protein
MSEENVEIVRQAIEASEREDGKRLGELIDPDVEMHGRVGGLEEGRVAHGLPEIQSSFEASDLEAWEERRLEPQRRDGRVVGIQGYVDQAAALEAVGLSD